MSTRFVGIVALMLVAVAGPVDAQSPAATDPASTPSAQTSAGDVGTAPEVRHLGGGRYQLGSITLEKDQRRFSVAGVIQDLGSPTAPLEFLAAARGSAKLYESLIELDTSVVEFNVACILIGLNADHGRTAKHHFDPDPVAGDAVSITVQWQLDGQTVQRSAGQLIRSEEANAVHDDWVYTGSVITPQGRVLAQSDGVLVGFVHAPETFIEHRVGLGLGDYGAVGYDPSMTPPAGTRVVLVVQARGMQGQGAQAK